MYRKGIAAWDMPIENPNSEDLRFALETISAFGYGNLIHAMTSLWHWDGSGVWRKIDDREVKKVIHRVAVSHHKLNKNKISSILDSVKTETIISKVFDNLHDVINCKNGELHYEDGKFTLKPHKREHYLTSQIKVEYTSEAKAPRFDTFLSEIFEHDDDASEKVRSLLEMIGYSLLSSCRFEKFIILIGNGANGKSVLLKVLSHLLGYTNVSAVCPSQFDNRFQRAHIQGKLANIVSELSEGGELADATLKAVVSGEIITAEHKHKPPFEFRPYCTCWFGTNHMPRTRDFSDAIYRRAIVLTFNRKFEGDSCDTHLADKLIAELPGILNMVLDALGSLIKRKEFTDPASSRDAKSSWRMESDQVAQFIEDCCQIHQDFETSSQAVYGRYQSWVRESGYIRPLNRKNFTNRLKRFGVEPFKGSGGRRMLFGIRLLEYVEMA